MTDNREQTTLATRTKRSRLRFGLMTLLLALTVFGVWLGMLVNRVKLQIGVIHNVEAMDGIVWFDQDREKWRPSWQNADRIRSTSSPGPQWLCEAIGDDYFRDIVQIDFVDGMESEQHAAPFERLIVGLNKLPELETIRWMPREERANTDSVERTAWGDAALAKLSLLTRCKNLTVDGFPVTDEDAEHIGRISSLETLNLPWTQITDEGLKHLGKLRNLRRLRIHSFEATSKGIETIVSLPNLQELILYDCDVTQTELSELTRRREGVQASIFYLKRTPGSSSPK